MYGDGSKELEMILANQKDGGYWVYLKWEKGCDWHIWVDSDEELEMIINREIAKGEKIKEIIKEK